jgi:hypothetical protein
MKRMKIWAIIMVAIMVLTACGNTKEVNNIDTETKESNISEDINSNKTEAVSEKTVESEIALEDTTDVNSMITERDDSELNLKSYHYSMEDRTVCDEGEDVFSSVMFDESNSTNYVTTGKVPIYAQNGIRIGYANEDVDIIVMGTYGDWCRFYLDKDMRYARLSDIEANAITMDERDAIVEEANKQAETSVKAETPVDITSVEPPVVDNTDTPVAPEPVEEPTTSDKYTPEEAMAVYRSLMEAGGITWNPALKDGGSWGTGFMYFDKGYPEWAASSSLESFAIGNHGGASWTEFYFEVTGSDEECVYYTMWAE